MSDAAVVFLGWLLTVAVSFLLGYVIGLETEAECGIHDRAVVAAIERMDAKRREGGR